MAGAWLAERCRRILRRSPVPDTLGTDAGRRLIVGDVDGALRAAEMTTTARNRLTRSEGFAVLAWVHLVRGEREAAEAAASVAQGMRTPDRLLTVALVVASGGPSTGAASALTDTQGVVSLVGATRVFADHDKLGDVRAEIARLSSEGERAALEALEVGLVARGDTTDIDEVADRLAECGRTPERDVMYASALGELGIPELALRYLELAAARGFDDPERVLSDPDLTDARVQPAFAAILDRIVANARAAAGDSGS